MNTIATVIDHEVQVKLIHLDLAATELEQLGLEAIELLSPDEREKARCMTLPARSQQWQVSRAMLRMTLGNYLDVNPQSITFEFNEFGKPHLSQALMAGREPLWFNTTHSGQYAAIALSRSGEVGIDLEAIRPVKRLEQKAQLFLSDAEQRELLANAEPDRERAFLRLWVLKETLAKAIGGGLQNRTRTLQVSCQPYPRAVDELSDSWTLEELCVPGYVGAIAFHRSGTQSASTRLASTGLAATHHECTVVTQQAMATSAAR